MVNEITTRKDLCASFALNLEQVLTHVNAVRDLSCPIACLVGNLYLVAIISTFYLVHRTAPELQILLAKGDDVVAT